MSKDIEDIGSIDDISGLGREADPADEVRTAPDVEPAGDLDQLDVEAPREDAAEQRVSAIGDDEEQIDEPPPEEVGEADPADAADQRRVVEEDEDDYR